MSCTDKTGPPPRSLQGVEDAAWDTIARRFPNAAPLLCEMETVIERAEDLLQQLRAAPCAQEVDTSSSFHTPDSRESNTTISMVSDIESFAEETNVPERTVENTEEVAMYDVHEESRRGGAVRRENREVEEYPSVGYHLNSPLDEVVQHFKTSSTKCRSSQGESEPNVTDSGDKRIDVSSEEIMRMRKNALITSECNSLGLAEMMTENNSLEGWTKAVNDALQELRDDTENIDASGDNKSEVRPNVDRNAHGCPLVTDGDSGREKTARESHGSNDVKVITSNLQDNVAESSTIIASRRSPLAVLEEYTKRCNVSIKYEHKPKSNLYVINGDLCGFNDHRVSSYAVKRSLDNVPATSCEATEDLAKNELAAKILWMVAECQMDSPKLLLSSCGLSNLSRDEMLEIMAFNRSNLKNASQKIYKFCLERGEPVPEYSIRNSRTNQGFVYMAECVALGYVGVGQGLRKDRAKMVAAENLYQKYTCEAGRRTT
ncbi:PREDICTED: uncharacterized protein LOC106741004 [Dinoponera quadriceps]|uniref:Uncharacterized protein LOC106741004 n=1 Tax=Dinoponera quadriceps TaxID=609295 RepID=A0A6P3WQ97_DINQU|nr:PREDICTED: uncharacterized protein LOC106741004 [Dinoponera quadriceps]